MGLELLNSPWTARAGAVRPQTAKNDARAGFLQIPVVSIPLRVRKGTVRHPGGSTRAPYGSPRIWKTLDIPVRGLCDARKDITRSSCGVLRIIWSNHKCAAVPNRTGPAPWCDHENSTDVNFTRRYGQKIVRVIKIVWGPWLDMA